MSRQVCVSGDVTLWQRYHIKRALMSRQVRLSRDGCRLWWQRHHSHCGRAQLGGVRWVKTIFLKNTKQIEEKQNKLQLPHALTCLIVSSGRWTIARGSVLQIIQWLKWKKSNSVIDIISNPNWSSKSKSLTQVNTVASRKPATPAITNMRTISVESGDACNEYTVKANKVHLHQRSKLEWNHTL